MSWREITLGSAIHVKHGFAFKGDLFADTGEYIVLTPGNFNEEGGFRARPEKDRFYAGDIPEAYVLAEGELIVAMTEQGAGLLGSAALVPKANYYLHNQRLGLVDQIDASVLDRRFLYLLFNSRSVRAQISGSASGTKVRHTAPERIYRVRAWVPDINIQRSISEHVLAYDDLIENNRRRMALLEESARLLYREWFVRLRFPGHEHTPIVDGVPQGWQRKTLGEVAHINQRNIGSAFDGEIEYIDIASVTQNSVNETTKYDFRDAPGRARRVVRHGDIIWSCVRPNRRSHAVIWQPAENLIVSTGFVVMSQKSLPTSFLYQAVTTDLFVGYLENHAKGAAYPAVVSGDFERATILVPPSALLTSFDDFAKPLLDQAQNLQLQNQKLRAARDLLLPRLMSGELAV
ncbi:MAG: restriction endonuclease subunit S [Betaproteobacteria bacterium HGW-Betaproteobacteria-10]|nr:MAG: restriction endonuclease subunit S [Betaproteobacteria bacterium HGW-Betaproteobacteria-10]